MRQLMFMAWVFGNYFFQVELISFSQHGMPQAYFQPRYSRERLSLYQDELNWLIFCGLSLASLVAIVGLLPRNNSMQTLASSK